MWKTLVVRSYSGPILITLRDGIIQVASTSNAMMELQLQYL